MKKLVLHTHTGLGDHIITNGMVHAFTEQYDLVFVPHIKMFSPSINDLYKDHAKIRPVALPDIDVTLKGMHLLHELREKENADMVSIADPYLYYPRRLIQNSEGNFEFRHVATNFDRQFYELAGMHFSLRYTKCKLPGSTKKSKQLYQEISKGNEYILVHNTSSQNTSGYPLDINRVTQNKGLPIINIVPGITDNVFEFYDLIVNASEIHAVGSFFQCLVDSLWKKISCPMFFHNIMIKHDTQINCRWNDNRWMILDYDRKY